MDSCPTCPKAKTPRIEMPRRRNSPRRPKYQAVFERKRRFSPVGCEGCGRGSREDLRIFRKPFNRFVSPCNSCPSPCRDNWCYPGPTESGLFNTIRSSIQRLFTGRKSNQLYMYTMSQLKCIEQLVEKLEEETFYIEKMMKQALESEIDCNNLQCSLNAIAGRVEGVKYDLMCARNCYDPCRDRCEFEFICGLTERVCGLESHLEDLCTHIECLPVPARCDPCCSPRIKCGTNCLKCVPAMCRSPNCFVGCSKTCDYSPCCKPGCGDNTCRTGCFDKPKCCGTGELGGFGNICNPKGFCRKSSVIPVGVMLVKL